MRVVICSSEAVPFAKTGGLADVSSALAKALAEAGHTVTLMIPFYTQLVPAQTAASLRDVRGVLDVPVGTRRANGRLLRTSLPAGSRSIDVILVDQPWYFDRKGLYSENGRDYPDNCERFVFFCRAVLETIERLDLRPEIIHSNDWQTGLVPALQQIEHRWHGDLAEAVSVFTIHNLAFQGQFWHWDMELTGLDWQYFNWRQLEHFSHLNLLKAGIVFADAVTTVSPTYAAEIQTKEFGCGLEGVLAAHRSKLAGILNGIDAAEWNPATDRFLAQPYSSDGQMDRGVSGKAACKADLQRRTGLAMRKDALLVGMISRMTEQKGFDLIEQASDDLVREDIQLCLLGTGDARAEALIRQLVDRHPQQVAATIGFSEELAHQIEAGADAFLMPSRYEPCGLNQMYSQRYGTVPVVRSVGGLADTVIDATPENLAAGTATGVCFDDYTPAALLDALDRTANLFRDKSAWRQLMRTGMHQDFSWQHSARRYVEVYRQALATRQPAVTV